MLLVYITIFSQEELTKCLMLMLTSVFIKTDHRTKHYNSTPFIMLCLIPKFGES